MAPTELASRRLEKEFAVQLASLQTWFKNALEELQAAEIGEHSLALAQGAHAHQDPTTAENSEQSFALAEGTRAHQSLAASENSEQSFALTEGTRAHQSLAASENSEQSFTLAKRTRTRWTPIKSNTSQEPREDPSTFESFGPAVQKPTEELPPKATRKDKKQNVAVAVEVAKAKKKKSAKRVPPMRQMWQADSENTTAPNSTKSMQLKRSRSNRVGDAISKAMDEDSENSFSQCSLPLHPNSNLRLSWDVLALLGILFDFVTIPLSAFGQHSNFVTTTALLVLGYWTLDMFMSCITAYMLSDGKVVKSYRLIIKRYAVTWFAPDVVIVIVEWLQVLSGSSGQRSGVAIFRGLTKLLRALRLVRMLRVLRLAKIRDIIMKLEESIDSEWVSILWGICCNVVVLLLMNHICCCLWFWVGQTSADAGDESWLVKYDVHGASFEDKYLTSLHWSLTQFTPAGMEVQPQSTRERLFAVSTLLLAMIMFSTFVSTVTAGMTRLRALQAEQQKDMFRLRKFLNVHRITPGLQARVFRYIDIVMKARRKVLPKSSVKLLQLMSGPLNIELLVEMYWPHLGKHPYFLSCLNSHTFGHLCCAAIDMPAVSASDKIFNRALKGKQFYVLNSGSTVYRVKESKQFASRAMKVPEGSWFSEAALWVHWYHQGTMQALTECQLMQVDAAKFAEVVLSNLKVAEQTREYAREFVQAMGMSIEKYGHAWDLSDDLIGSLGVRLAPSKSPRASSAPATPMKVQQMTEAEAFELRMMAASSDSSDSEDEEGEDEQNEEQQADSNSPNMAVDLDKDAPELKEGGPVGGPRMLL